MSTTPEGDGPGRSSAPDASHRPPLVVDAVRRRWRLIAIVAAFCILAAVAYGQVRRAQYDAHTTVIVSPVAGAPFSEQQTGNLLVDLSTEAQVVRSDAVARLANDALKTKGYDKLTVAGLIARTSVTVETNAQVLRISYEAGSPTRARDGADAVAAAYLQYREQLADSTARQQLAGIASDRKELEDALRLDRSKLATLAPTSTSYSQVSAQIKAAEKRLFDLRVQETDINKRPVYPGEVLSPATLPSAPHGLSAPILGGGGLLIGLLLGTIVAIARERTVGTIRRVESLPDEPPVLTVVPRTPGPEPILLSKPTHRAAEAYRLLSLSVAAALPSSGPAHSWGRLVVVSSLTDPAPPVAINLALAMAESGRSCVYVEALPGHSAPRLPALGVDLTRPGFADAVLHGGEPQPAPVPAAPRLSVLPGGTDLARAGESYGGPRTHRVLSALRRSADIVVVAAPPLTDPDGQALAIEADTVVVVAPIAAATFGQLAESLAEAQRVRSSVLGVVAFHPTRGGGARVDARQTRRSAAAPYRHDSVPT